MLVLAHLGSTPALSVAELLAVLPGLELRDFGANWCSFDCVELPKIDALGGIVRFVDLGDGLPVSRQAVPAKVTQLVADAAAGGRAEFGVTVIAGDLGIGKLGMQVKGLLQTKGVKSRFTAARRGVLATGLVRSRKLIEIVLLEREDGTVLGGHTIAVQDPRAYTIRDMEKPARNLQRGMLPPKLAQILLNLTQSPPETIALDPFCGTGTVLLEALAQGRAFRGSDVDPKAIMESEQNVRWFAARLQRELPEEFVHVADARELPRLEGLGAIATEGTLGDLLHAKPNAMQVHETHRFLASIYQPFFQRAALLLPSGGRLVMTLPAYRGPAGHVLFPPEQFKELLPSLLTIDPLLPSHHASHFLPRLTLRGGIVVDRPDQFVGREVVRLRRT